MMILSPVELLSSHAALEKEIRKRIDQIFIYLGVSESFLPSYTFEFLPESNRLEISWDEDDYEWLVVPIEALELDEETVKDALASDAFDSSQRAAQRNKEYRRWAKKVKRNVR